MKIHDLIIVGAGPAGATAAEKASQSGLDVLILDKEEFPREKPCGGGLSAGAYDELGEELPEDLIEKRCYGMRSLYKDRVHITRTETPVAYMIKREEFDHYLLKKALQAGSVFSKEECRSVRETSGLVEVETDRSTHYGKYCIGADGFFSVTSKAVREPFSPDEVRFCLVSRHKTEEHPIYKEDNPLVELDFGFIKKGYGWLFPKSGFISAGMGGDMIGAKELSELYKTFLEAHGIDGDGKPRGCYIPVSNMKHKIHTDRIMLAGDAAGLVDSFSGEGIRNAIISGRLAARSATEALNSKGIIVSYGKRINSLLASDMKWSEKISHLSYRFEDIVFGHLLREDRIMNNYFQVLRGKRSYRSFFFSTAFALPFIMLRNRKRFTIASDRTGRHSPL